MKTLNQFKKYFSVGIINTAFHWLIFLIFVYFFGLAQSISNLIAFLFAVSVSYILNALYTFKKELRVLSYLVFSGFMGLISFLTGAVADKLVWAPWITLVVFSSLSLALGFLYSKFIVFKD